MRQLIDYHIKSSPDQAQDALNKKLTDLWQQSQTKSTSQEYFILFEYGNQKTLLKAEFPGVSNDKEAR